MVHSEPVKVIIDAPRLVEVIINAIVCYYEVLESIVLEGGWLFISKFWFSLCYFLAIKKKAIDNVLAQTDGQTKRENNTIEAYLRALINWK